MELKAVNIKVFMHYKNINFIFLLLIGTACSMADYKPESISKYQAGEIETVLLGTILQLESVVIEGNRDLGAAAGAAVGGDLGSDNDKAPFAAGVIGALIGSAVGAQIGSEVNEKRAIELTIELDNGKIVSIVQEVSDKYIFFEITKGCLFILFIFLSISWLLQFTRLVSLTNLIQVDIFTIFYLSIFLIPNLVIVILPIVIIFGLILSFLKLCIVSLIIFLSILP